MLTDLIQRVRATGDRHEGDLVPGLTLFQRDQPTTFQAMIYEPLVCLILQGEKRVTMGDHAVVAGAGKCILVSHATPVVSRITQASRDEPYLALIARLDVVELRSLYADVGWTDDDHPSAFTVTPIDAPTLDVLTRYVALAHAPDDARVLGPLVRRELHYRLLCSDVGGMLRQLLRQDSHASHIARAIELLRSAYRERLEMDDVARHVGMSTSAFYKHFKSVTSTSPLQFQKDLRLTEAQRLLVGGEHTVSTAAFAVGYESPSQFSREYARKFGGPPRDHLATHRSSL